MFQDRVDAGKQLADALSKYKGKDTVVLALPRGGIVLGAQIAKQINAPLGLVLVRKIGYPSWPEYAIGAVVEGEKPLYNKQEVAAIDKHWLKRAEEEANRLLQKRRELYYGEVKPPQVKGKTVIVVDDGVATGFTMEASLQGLKNKGAKRLVAAVPVAPSESVEKLKKIADEVIVLDNPENFLGAVGSHYREFQQVDDKEVVDLLKTHTRN